MVFRACNFSLGLQPNQKSLKVRESILLDFRTFVNTTEIPVSKHKTRNRSGNNKEGNRITLSESHAEFSGCQIFL